jgi:hypothetical protein
MALVELIPTPVPLSEFLDETEIATLTEWSSMLEEYFSIRISDGNLTHLPFISQAIIKPDFTFLSAFLKALT